MEHSFYRDKLSAFHDGQLTAEEQRMLQEHIDSCPECRKALEEYERLDALIDRHADLDDSDYWEKSARKIEKQLGFETTTEVTDVRRSWKGLGWKIAAVAASVAVLTFIGLHQDELYQSATPEAPARMKAPAVHSMDDEYVLTEDNLSTASLTEEEPADHMDDEAATVSSDAADEPRRDQIVAESVEHKVAQPEAAPATPPEVPKESDLEGTVEMDDVKDVPVKRETIAAPSVAIPAPAREKSKAAAAKPKAAADSVLTLGTEAISFDAGAVTGAVQKPAGETAADMLFMDVAPTQDKDEESSAERSLADWRQIRDSLSRVEPRLNFPSLRESALQQAAVKGRSNLAAAEPDPEAEKKLVEAYYRIALLTPEKTERDRSTAWLRGYRDKADASFKKLADNYLEEIEKLPDIESDEN